MGVTPAEAAIRAKNNLDRRSRRDTGTGTATGSGSGTGRGDADDRIPLRPPPVVNRANSISGKASKHHTESNVSNATPQPQAQPQPKAQPPAQAKKKQPLGTAHNNESEGKQQRDGPLKSSDDNKGAAKATNKQSSNAPATAAPSASGSGSGGGSGGSSGGGGGGGHVSMSESSYHSISSGKVVTRLACCVITLQMMYLFCSSFSYNTFASALSCSDISCLTVSTTILSHFQQFPFLTNIIHPQLSGTDRLKEIEQKVSAAGMKAIFCFRIFDSSSWQNQQPDYF
jgi:hypothetical protein